MRLNIIASEVVKRLIRTKTLYRDPIRDCLEAYLQQKQLVLSDRMKDQVCELVALGLKRMLDSGLP